jgi:TolB-like protein/DNA-binding winged helix-turn-helix (wHTH) protein
MNERASQQGLAANRLPLGEFVLDLLAGELLTADGGLAGLRRQALEVLLLLGTRSGQVVTKDELMQRVWPGLVVGDGSLTQAVADIRRVLGDHEHALVRNVARRGYMLVPGAPGRTAHPPPPTSVPDPAPEPASTSAATAPNRHWPAVLGLLGLTLLVAAVAALVIHGSAPTWQTPAGAARPPLPENVPALSIAVMPLALEGDAGGADWLADALHGDLITEIQRSPGILLIARDTMATYNNGKPADPRQVARELGVRHIVRGSLRREGEQIRLNLALVDGESGVQQWADTFVAERATLPQTLNDFAVRIERTLQTELYRVSVARRETLSTDQVTADDLGMRAYALWFRGFTRDNVLQALALCERAVELDPDSLRAWNGVAYLNVHAALNGWQPDRALALKRIEHAAAQLERIDRDAYQTYNAKTIILFSRNDVEGMLRLTRGFAGQHPNYPHAHGAFGAALMFNGHFDDAVRAFERALRLSPRDTIRAEWQYRLSMAHFSAGRYELARDWAQTAATTNPGLRWPPIHAAALWHMGQADAARQALADYEARHGAFKPAQVRPRLPGDDPRFAPQRDRLIVALAQAGAR